jgi:hypothetical protein
VIAREDVYPVPPGFTEVACPAGPGSSGPFLNTTACGPVTLSWVEPAGEGHRLRFATWEKNAWREPRTVAEGTDWFVNWADVPSVIAGDDGRMAAHWLEKSGQDTYAYDVRVSQSFDGGATWTEPVTPHDDGTRTEHGFASLIFHDDYLHLVWLDGRKFAEEDQPDEMTLRAARIDRDGNISGQVLLDGRTCDCCPTAIAPIASGFIVAYRDRSPEEIRDISVVRHVDGRWEQPRRVHSDGWKINGCPVNGPAMASDGTNVAVAWFTMDGDEAVVRGSWSRDSGATFARAVEIADEEPLGRVSMTSLVSRQTTVAWLSSASGRARVECRHMGKGTVTEEAHTLVYTSTGRSSGYPRIASPSDFLVAWTESGELSRVRTAIVAPCKELEALKNQ